MEKLLKPTASEKQDLKQLQTKLNFEVVNRNRIFNQSRLRQTIISGIPCDFIEFEKIILPPNPGAAQSEASEAMTTYGPPADKKYFNLRHKVWHVAAKQDEV